MKIYISNLRNLATFSVVFLHVAAVFLYQYGSLDNNSWKLANFLDSFVRFCVPLFVMISGALLLGKEFTLKEFLSKRISRIIYPLIFWSIVYFIYINYSNFSTVNIDVIITQFLKGLSKGMYYHFWFVYMILGLYLFMPILNTWIKNSSKREVQYFLFLFFITVCNNKFTNEYFPNIDLMYFSKFIGFLIVGYYIDRYIKNGKKALIIGAFLFVLGTLLTYFFTNFYSFLEGGFVETFYDYTYFNVVLQSIGIFIVGKNLFIKTTPTFQSLDKNSFGIYFIHILILERLSMIFPYVDMDEKNMYSLLGYIVVVSISVFIISYIIVFTLSKVPFLKKIIT